MKNHNEKQRDMIRSVLPSTKRTYARYAKRSFNKAHRHRVKQTLHNYNIIPYKTFPSCEDGVCEWSGVAHTHFHPFEMIDDENAERRILNADSIFDSRIKEVMWERRDGDKLGPIISWAQGITKHIDDPQEAYLYVKPMLSKTPMGRHALTHIRFADGFDDGSWGWRWNGDPAEREREAFVRACRWAEVGHKLKWVIREGRSEELARMCGYKRYIYNRNIKEYEYVDTSVNYLCRFEEDIPDFLKRPWSTYSDRYDVHRLSSALDTLYARHS